MDMLNTSTLIITHEFLNIIAAFDEFKGAWKKAVGNIAPERLSALRRVATIESAGSSTRIEGSFLSDYEVRKIYGNIAATSFNTQDEQDVAGYLDALDRICRSWELLSLTEDHIRELHCSVLRFSVKDAAQRGSWKNSQNIVGAFDENGRQIGIVCETATPSETPRLMSELVRWTNTALETRDLHPLLVIGIFTVVFLSIHPFQDGNGRLSRILTDLLLLRSGYAYTQYCSLESVIEKDKQGYYLALRKTQQTLRTGSPDWQPWLLFFLRALRQQKLLLEQEMEQEHKLRARLPDLSRRILEYASENDCVTVSKLVTLTGASRNTLKKQLSHLVERNYLMISGKGRGSRYIAK